MSTPYPPRGTPVWQDQQGYEDEEGDGYGYGTPTDVTRVGSDPAKPDASLPAYPITPNNGSTGAPGPAATPGDGGTSGTASNSPTNDPTAPLHDDSSTLNSVLTGPAQSGTSTAGPYSPGIPVSPTGGPLFGDAKADLARTQGATTPQNDYGKGFHGLSENDYKQNENAQAVQDGRAQPYPDAGLPKFTPFDGRGPFASSNDARNRFGYEEPDKLSNARAASGNGNDALGRQATAINSGDINAVGTADDILKNGEPGLTFFQFFAPAYSAWSGTSVTYDELKHEYEAEYGMSFADYAADATTLADIASKLEDTTTTLNQSYDSMIPQWSGPAAQAFEQKMAVFFTAADTVSSDVSVVGKDVGSLVKGLQQLILAKAQTVGQIYTDLLARDIDGVMASRLVEVAKGTADKDTKLTAFFLLGGTIHQSGGILHTITNVVTLGTLDAVEQVASENAAADAAPQMAANWCTGVLVPQFEAREQAVRSVDAETKQRIQQAFAAFTGQFEAIPNPFTAMDSVGNSPTNTHKPKPQPGAPQPGAQTPSGVTTAQGAGTGAPGTGNGASGPVSATPTVTTGTGAGSGGGGDAPATAVPPKLAPVDTTAAQGTGSGAGLGSTTGLGTGIGTGTGIGAGLNAGTGADGTTRPSGLPAGAGWLAPGVPLPSGWTENPTTGQILPPGWTTDPKTGQPVAPTSGTGSAGTGSVGSGSAGTGTAGAAGTAGTKINPKDDIHKNKDGSVSLGEDKSVTIGTEAKKGVFTITDTDPDGTKHTYHVHFDAKGDPVVTEVVPTDGGVAAAGLGGLSTPSDLAGVGAGGSGLGGSGLGGGAGGGLGGGGGGGSAVSAGPGIGGGGASTTAAAHAGAAGGHADLQSGAQVGADNNAMAASATAAPSTGSPVAGSAAGGSEHSGGTGGAPLLGGGGARGGGGGGGGEEAARKYQPKGDVVGEKDLEQWQRMGPVVGEQ